MCMRKYLTQTISRNILEEDENSSCTSFLQEDSDSSSVGSSDESDLVHSDNESYQAHQAVPALGLRSLKVLDKQHLVL